MGEVSSLHRKVVVVGASGFGRETLDTLVAMQNNGDRFEIVGVVDDSPSQVNLTRLEERGIRYLGTTANFLQSNRSGVFYLLGIGNPQIREKIVRQFDSAGLKAFVAVHPTAIIGTKSEMSPGTVICAGAILSTNIRLGRHVHVNPNVTIGHDSSIGDFVSLNPNSTISGDVILGNRVLVGAASTVLQQIQVQNDCIIGAMALVTRNVPSDVVVKGIPGRWASN